MPAHLTISDYRAAVRGDKFIFPGGGEIYYLCSDGGILCHDCAFSERRNILSAIRDGDSSGWRVVAIGNTYNEEPGDRTCDHCGEDIGDQGDKLTAEDIAHLETEVARRREDNMRDPSDPEYDEGGPEPVMTSLGYVDIWVDGDVICNGTTIYTVSE